MNSFAEFKHEVEHINGMLALILEVSNNFKAQYNC